MRILVLALVFLAGPVLADDWRKLTGPEIEQALNARVVGYEGAQQDFFASGKTLYDAGVPSWGYWRVQGDRYCSQWPPNAGWDCYEFFLSPDGLRLRFVSEQGHSTEGKFVDLN
ncbi:MAG: hypothetical protein GY947_08500 [Rhodobacteraceae bacterium]|nr:hypothetical protein [Paracoccaceae bacterium]